MLIPYDIKTTFSDIVTFLQCKLPEKNVQITRAIIINDNNTRGERLHRILYQKLNKNENLQILITRQRGK